MSSILDQLIQIGVESTYGTAVAPTRAYEGQSDTFTREVEFIESVGFRQAMQTVRSDRHDTISVGASGSIEVDVLNKGHGLIIILSKSLESIRLALFNPSHTKEASPLDSPLIKLSTRV